MGLPTGRGHAAALKTRRVRRRADGNRLLLCAGPRCVPSFPSRAAAERQKVRRSLIAQPHAYAPRRGPVAHLRGSRRAACRVAFAMTRRKSVKSLPEVDAETESEFAAAEAYEAEWHKADEERFHKERLP
jgi:hypothetical protein